MKSPEQEAFAQLMFFLGMGCLPIAFTLALVGAACKQIGKAIIFFALGGLAFNHFLFYFTVLGGSLGTKVGTYELPNWFSFLPYSALASGLLIGLWIFFHKSK